MRLLSPGVGHGVSVTERVHSTSTEQPTALGTLPHDAAVTEIDGRDTNHQPTMTPPAFATNPGECPHCGEYHDDHDNCDEKED